MQNCYLINLTDNFLNNHAIHLVDMGDSYRDWTLEDFLNSFSKINSVSMENGKEVQPYIQNPAHYQKKMICKGVSSLVSALRIDVQFDTVHDLVSELSVVREDLFHIAQCYLAMVPVVLGHDSLIGPVQPAPGEELFNFQSKKERFYKAVKKSGKPEPCLFGDDANLVRTYNKLHLLSEAWKKKRYHFEPSEHNIEQLSAIVRCAKDENEFLSVFYKYIVSPALRIE